MTTLGGRAASERRRVLHVMRMSGVAGSEGHLEQLTRGLATRGWAADVLIPSPAPDAVAAYASRLARHCGTVRVLASRRDADPRLLDRLRRAVRSDQSAVVHTHLVHADWHAALAGVTGSPAALVTTKHNHDPFRLRQPVRTVERLANGRFDAVVAISESLAEFTRENGAPAIRTIHYGVAPPARPAAVAPPSPPVRLLGIGRLERQKGFDVLLRAMSAVTREVPEVELRILGEGTERRRLEAMVIELGLRDQVRLPGWSHRVEEELDNAHLLVHPARWEGFGLVLLEAMLAGRPVIASRVGAIPEIVTDGTGQLVAPEDHRALAEAIVRAAREPRWRAEAAVRARRRAIEDFSLDAMVDATAQLYDDLVARSLRARAASTSASVASA